MPQRRSSTNAPTNPPVRKPLLLQDLGERALIVVKVEAAVVADAVPAGKRAGHQRRVRRQRQRHHRRRLLESQARRRQRIDPRRLARRRSDSCRDDPHARCRARRAAGCEGRSVGQPHAGDRPDEEDPAAGKRDEGGARSTRRVESSGQMRQARWSSRTRSRGILVRSAAFDGKLAKLVSRRRRSRARAAAPVRKTAAPRRRDPGEPGPVRD